MLFYINARGRTHKTREWFWRFLFFMIPPWGGGGACLKVAIHYCYSGCLSSKCCGRVCIYLHVVDVHLIFFRRRCCRRSADKVLRQGVPEGRGCARHLQQLGVPLPQGLGARQANRVSQMETHIDGQNKRQHTQRHTQIHKTDAHTLLPIAATREGRRALRANVFFC